MERAGSAIPEALGATEVGPQDGRTLLRMAGQLATLGDVPTPTLFVLPSEEPNAFATGFTPDDSAVTFTTGLLERLDHNELRAVMAHEIGHIVSGDVAEGTRLVQKAAMQCNVTFGLSVAAGVLALVTDSLLDDWLVLGVGRLVNSTVQKRAQARIAAHSRVRELRADEFAVRAGGAPWLASALLKIEAAAAPPEAKLPAWSRLILLSNAETEFHTHPPTGDRIAAMPPFSFEALNRPTCPSCAAHGVTPHTPCAGCGDVTEQRHCGCGAAVAVFDPFCWSCGGALVTERCRWCGAPAEASASRCGECEAPLP